MPKSRTAYQDGIRPWQSRWEPIRKSLETDPVPRITNRVIELGAAEGRMSLELARLGYQVDAWEMVRRLAEPHPNINWIQSKINHDEIDTPYDVGLAIAVLHHLPDYLHVLMNLVLVSTLVFIEPAHPDEHQHYQASKQDLEYVYNYCLEHGSVIAEHPVKHGKIQRPTVRIDP